LFGVSEEEMQEWSEEKMSDIFDMISDIISNFKNCYIINKFTLQQKRIERKYSK